MNASIREAAKNIIKNMEHLVKPHTYAEIDSSEFKYLNLTRYAEQKDALTKYGFRHLANYEILEVTNSPNTIMARTFVQCMTSTEGEITSGYFQAHPKIGRLTFNLLKGILNFRLISAFIFYFKNLQTKHCQDFETEFSDNSFIITSNAEAAGTISRHPSIDAEFHPYATPVKFLLIRHCERIKEKLKSSPSLSFVRIRSKEDVLAMQKRQKEIKDAFRIAVNCVTPEEIQNWSKNKAIAEAVIQEVQIIMRERKDKV